MADNKSTDTRTNTNKMLIDATHPEETRVVVLRDNRVEEFDYESAARKLLRGNIYLAKVTRVEPSLQAAFVDYGGNRHGFLAFNEIHPDYYQIPIADRLALKEAEAAEEAEAAAIADAEADAEGRRRSRQSSTAASPAYVADEAANDDIGDVAADMAEDQALDVTEYLPPEHVDDVHHDAEAAVPSASDADRDAAGSAAANDQDSTSSPSERSQPERVAGRDPVLEGDVPSSPEAAASSQETADTESTYSEADIGAPAPIGLVEDEGVTDAESETEAEAVDLVEEVTLSASDDALEELPSRPRRRMRSYKIQEVIKRKQIILIQVVKEERGTKGAALTTYLSLAGRYTVLMPNTARGGGISRKITNPQDRKRLKAIADELDIPEDMGLIIRTAGASRTKQEIRRDFEYLLRLWESVRELTLQSTAPTLVYEEGNLVKRSIRDLYGKEVDEIIVAGDAAYREAKDFMRMLMPSHVKNVTNYQGSEPLFTKYQIERQLNAMFSPYVYLRSGGYLVINQTEALVAVDVNSGKATREFSIEETALNTNLEAAEELARQLKLRDLAGLIVVDFIDMEEKRNNRSVERRLKDALRNDRARIQVGHISHFGLLEMSRQRMRTGVLEGSTTQCPHCQGTGIIRSTESVALSVLRALEDALSNNRPAPLCAHTTTSVALYLLNNKRQFINDMESRYGVSVTVMASDKMEGSDFNIEQLAVARGGEQSQASGAVSMDWSFNGDEAPERETRSENRDGGDAGESGDTGDSRRRGRRRRRRGRRDDGGERAAQQSRAPVSYEDDQPDIPDTAFVNQEEAAELDASESPQAEGGESNRGRRRGRRGGRRNRRGRPGQQADAALAATENGDWQQEPGNGVETNDAYGEPSHSDPVASPATYNGSVADAYPHGSESDIAVAQAEPSPEIEPEQPVEITEERAAEPSTEPQPDVSEPWAAASQEPASRQEVPATEQQVVSEEGSAAQTEPVLERVFVGPEREEAATPPPVEEPAKRGWWSRRIGG
ncbi:MAG: hypothetical protein RLZ98_1383 [Pseudomonadota bacterium]|jgi:ribonuclease E